MSLMGVFGLLSLAIKNKIILFLIEERGYGRRAPMQAKQTLHSIHNPSINHITLIPSMLSYSL